MDTKLISLTAGDKLGKDGSVGLEIIANSSHITHFYEVEQRESSLTRVHFSGGQEALVTQSVEEVKQLIHPSTRTRSPDRQFKSSPARN